ncbi:MAG: DUF1016 N-terminal domain-containing protein [bacterium]
MASKNKIIQKSGGGLKRVDTLFSDIRELILLARRAAVRSVDTLQVLTSFEIGRRIVNHEQQGAARAEYGKQVLKELADRLTAEFGRGFSRSNLEYMRKFFLFYAERLPEISQIPSGKLQASPHGKSQMPFGKKPAILPFLQHIPTLPAVKGGTAAKTCGVGRRTRWRGMTGITATRRQSRVGAANLKDLGYGE